MKDIQYRLEYLLTRAGFAIFDRLSLDKAIGVAGLLADVFFRICRRRREVAIDNIMASGIVSAPMEAGALARESFRHFALMLVETMHARDLLSGPAQGAACLTWNVHPESQKLLEDPDQPFILACGHLGNWEIGAQALAGLKPVAAVARHMNNRYLESYLRQRNPRRRLRQLPKYGNNPLRMLDLANQGEVMALMIDQHARQQSIWLDFLGRPASSYTAVALLPLVLRVPLCFGYCVRTGRTEFKMTLSEPLDISRSGNRDADIRRILSDLNRRLEDAIRLFPGQYLWAHRRWREPVPQGDRR